MGPRPLFSAFAARARVRRDSAPDCPRGAEHRVFADGAAKMRSIGPSLPVGGSLAEKVLRLC